MPIPTTTTWRMADQLAGGGLAETIVELRRSGASDEKIGHELYKQFGIEVTRSTVTAWRKKLLPRSSAATR